MSHSWYEVITKVQRTGLWGGSDVFLFKRCAGPFIIQLLDLEAAAVLSVSFFFSCKFKQIGNIVRRRGCPLALRRFSLALSPVSPERDVPFQVLPPCLIQNFLFPFLTNSLGEWARAGSLSKRCSNPAKGRGEGEKNRERKIFCRRLPSDIPLHVLFFPPLRG